MSTTLNDKNIKSVISDIPKKGFRTKFWREYRAGACKGNGVGKIMDSLEKMGIPASGDPANADLDEMPNIVQAFSALSNAMLKADGKCGKFQSHSKALCVAYRKAIVKAENKAADMARNADKIRQQQMAQKLKIEKSNEDTDKHLSKLKKENDQRKQLIKKELAGLDVRANKIEDACDAILKDIKQTRKEFAVTLKAFKSQHDKEGVNNEALEAKIDTTYRAIYKKRNIELHGKNIKSSLPKILKEATSLLSQYFKEDSVKKERVITGKKLKAAQQSFVKAQDEQRLIEAQFKQLLDQVQSARGEGR